MTQTAPSFSGPGPSFQAVSACSVFPHRQHTTGAWSLVSRALCLQSLRKCPGSPHRQHTGRSCRWRSGDVGIAPAGTLSTCRSLAGDQAAAFTAFNCSAQCTISLLRTVSVSRVIWRARGPIAKRGLSCCVWRVAD
jgi:hypothetical protein